MYRTKSRTYHDPLHGAITLDGSDPTEALLITVIDTPEFQRLRRIRQLDAASLTFHGAEGSRFTHSLGVMALTRRAFDRLAKVYPALLPHRLVVLTAALLHDVGHSAFSHGGEEMFGSNHEFWTKRLICESPLRAVLEKAHSGLNLPELLVAVYDKRYPLALVHQIVSSQLDCDRLDYLQRDGYFTGARYGQLDLDRIVMAMDYDLVTQQLVVNPKGLVAIEHYLMVRYFMYAQVYNHPKNLASRFVLNKIIQRAKTVLDSGLPVDSVMASWLRHDPQTLSCEDYLAFDDVVLLYHLHQWRRGNDQILADLCRRYLDRDICKTQELSKYPEVERRKILQEWQIKLQERGLDPHYYCGRRVSLTKGYTLYSQGIEVRTTHGLQDIANVSPVVATLAQSVAREWLIYTPILTVT
ncbi:MAG: HD domain-containing protein [Oscillatoriales cyanobacterium SM2_2_1]|nr:HD domain-containing protein [Oscillatoriales cyanobacterium SM2_2_1]